MRFKLGALLAAALAFGAATMGVAQEFSARARLDGAQSGLTQSRGAVIIDLALSQPVPWRVFTLDDPRRLVLDFREVDFTGVDPVALRGDVPALSDLRFGALRPGWSRLVADLAVPMVVAQAGMQVDTGTGAAHLRLALRDADAAVFAEKAGAPVDPGWADLAMADPTKAPDPGAAPGDLIVAIDPGHGGIDPGASREGVVEAQVMLALGLELSEAINRQPGMRAVLTRDSDVFVPLEARMTIARAAGASVMLSLHADALALDQAAGASVYVLTAEAQDQAAERMARRHERGDLLAGIDLSGQDDTLARVLMELARQETGPASTRLQAAIIGAMGRVGTRLTARPERKAELAVLMSADFPSVLIEAGFLSNAADRAALSSPEGRAPIVAGLILGLQDWIAQEAALAPLKRR